ncbi:MAG TPA: putative metal-binding motif-containing protein [Myxococcaceae bacterium]|jgi:hypothetical protein
MSSSLPRIALSVFVVLALYAVVGGACYESPRLDGYYTCVDDTGCANGLVCDDGVCCAELGEPLCLARVLDGGLCADGGAPTRYFTDEDRDSYGNLTRPLLRCAPPLLPGAVTNADDCNDNPAAGGNLVFPGAPEQCDGQDNDCDGQFDEGFDGGTYYRDQDNDRFGDTNVPGIFCRQPPGWSEFPTDCAPTINTIYPGAPEVCNRLDDDCDSDVDEGVAQTYYLDGDKDGFGRLNMQRQGCAQNDDYVVNSEDCDDTNQFIHPDALDVCDEVDNNCNRVVDERPDCGGPLDLLALSSTGQRGALDTRANLNGTTDKCLRYFDGGIPESFSASNAWSGSKPTSHVVWFEAAKTWDLSKAKSLAIQFNTNMSGNVHPSWALHKQPIVLLCSEQGSARYVPRFDGGPTPLMPFGNSRVNTVLPLGQGIGTDWVEVSNALHLQAVKRVEILVEPSDAGSPNVAFDIQFIKLGFQ